MSWHLWWWWWWWRWWKDHDDYDDDDDDDDDEDDCKCGATSGLDVSHIDGWIDRWIDIFWLRRCHWKGCLSLGEYQSCRTFQVGDSYSDLSIYIRIYMMYDYMYIITKNYIMETTITFLRINLYIYTYTYTYTYIYMQIIMYYNTPLI